MNLLNPERIKRIEKLATLLLQKNWQVTCAESCTGGGLAHAFTSLSGSSAWFERSWVTYSNKAKHECLGVDEVILEQFGAVSSQTVEQMAQGAAHLAKANIAVSISGIAGPDGGTPDKPVGLVWFGVTCAQKTTTSHHCLTGDRHAVREQAIDLALEKLIARLVA